MNRIRTRFDATIPQNSLVPAGALLRFFEGQLDPVTGKDDPSFGYTKGDKKMLLSVAEANSIAINSLKSFSTPLWISGAGGPGAGKTTALLQFADSYMGEHADASKWGEASLASILSGFLFEKKSMAFVSADRKSLWQLSNVIQGNDAVSQQFYTYWRWGTNYLSNLDLSNAFSRRTHILHDTTLAGFSNLPRAKEAGYHTVVVMTASPQDTRHEAANFRNTKFFQSFPANVVEQDRKFAENLPKIVAQADEMHILWRDTAKSTAEPAAMIAGGKMVIMSANRFAKVTELYPFLGNTGLPLSSVYLKSRVLSLLRQQPT
ncbi:MAG: hypothetical protein P4M15_11080 [Alphaproteobacteria bacterium]|nr:hypothetical protein [Alphaproteobacteria bacterium]